MMRQTKTRVLTGILSLGSILAMSSPAFAIERLLSIGHSGHENGDDTVFVNTATNDTFLIDFAANRSYACDAVATASDSDFDWSLTVTGTSSGSPETVTARAAGAIVPITAGEGGTGNQDNRITLTPTTTDRFRLTVASTKVGGEYVRIRCFATTLFGQFNTNVNDFNFLELTNIGNAQISGTITAITSDGTTVINAVPFTVEAQRRTDIDLHTAVGVDKYGIVRVTHNGPLGTLIRTVSQYQGTVSNFSLTATLPMVLFDQRP